VAQLWSLGGLRSVYIFLMFMELEEDTPQMKDIRDKVSRDLSKPIRELLETIHEGVKNRSFPATGALQQSLAEFATFLGRLSIEADIQTRRIVCLTRWIVVLTVILVALTLVLVHLTQELAQSK
jgi:hypothetical protein